MKKPYIHILLLMICFLVSACGPALVVNSDGNGGDINVGDGKCETSQNECTLRAAIMEANHADDVSKITFENVTQINPSSPLPPLTASNTHIDGNGLVTLSGDSLTTESYLNNGFEILDSSYNIIQGMKIIHFSKGIYIHTESGNARYNKIGLLPANLGDSSKINFINKNNQGVVLNGQGASENVISGNSIGQNFFNANTSTGITISNGAHDNLIGSLTDIASIQGGNLIGSNIGAGIVLTNVSGNHISGNFIGTFWTDSENFGNSEGIRIQSNSHDNFIGIAPDGTGFMNVISGNDASGIFINVANQNYISGNHIGTDHTGTLAVPNQNGIYIAPNAMGNYIGTNGDGNNDAAEGNLISGNTYRGVVLSGSNVTNNVIAGNYIGTDASGTSALPNGGSGILFNTDGVAYNRVGTDGNGTGDTEEGNLISGNGTSGISLSGHHNQISGNLIGTDHTGLAALGNSIDGIRTGSSAHDNLIGTNGDGIADAAERNIISGNLINGVDILGYDNLVAGNYIGTDITGAAGLENGQTGVGISQGAHDNLIGTDGNGQGDSVEGNLISGNGWIGVWISAASNNTVAGNLIGTDLTGTNAIPNTSVNELFGAVQIDYGSLGNIIGTNSDGQGDSIEGNLISGNNRRGVVIKDSSTSWNVVAGNLIGTDVSGAAALGNGLGVEITNGAESNRVGTDGNGSGDSGERNIISGNSSVGIFIRGDLNNIAGNYIGTDLSGTADLGNGLNGVTIEDTSHNNLIGGTVKKANTIAFNGKDGVYVNGQDTNWNLITFNSIHSNDESGIDLGDGQGSWFTPNDPGDIDEGSNSLMNFPDLIGAMTNNGSTMVTGEILDGLSSAQIDLHFYAVDTCDPGGHGEGKTFLGTVNVGTDNIGNNSFLVNLNPGASAGQFVTATATHNNTTSEFSNCVEVTESTNYSQELEDPICQEFDMDLMKLVTFEVKAADRIFDLYIKNLAGPFPGGDEEASDDGQHSDGYYALLGDIESLNCNFQGFPDRIYCRFLLDEEDANTIKLLKVYFNLCNNPFFVNPTVGIPPFAGPKDPGNTPSEEPDGCREDLSERDCIAAGGSWPVGRDPKCVCP